MELILFLGRDEKIHFSLFKGWRRSSRIFRFNKMADVDVDDFLGARRRSAAIRPREAAIGRRLVLDRGRGPGRAESQISSFSFPFLHSDLLKLSPYLTVKKGRRNGGHPAAGGGPTPGRRRGGSLGNSSKFELILINDLHWTA